MIGIHFYIYRMIIGHVTYHSFMLTPLALFLLLWKNKTQSQNNFFLNLFLSVIIAFIFSYVVYSGGLHLIMGIGFAMLTICCFHYFFNRGNYIWIRLGLSLFLGLLIMATKINASFSLMQNVPRPYGIWGLKDLSQLISQWFRALFFKFEASGHEWEFGVTPIPIILVVLFLVSTRQRLLQIPKHKGHIAFFVLGFIFTIMPLAISYQHPTWYSFLESLPLIKNFHMIHRVWAAYIPLFIILSVFFLKKQE